MDTFTPYIAELECISNDIKMQNNCTEIAFNVINAALKMKDMSYDEICVQLDLNNIHFIHDIVFTRICQDYTVSSLSQLKYMPEEHMKMYFSAIKRFFDVISKIQIEDIWST